MYKLGGKRKLGRTASHRKAMIKNQVRSLLISGKVVTTTPKAKILKANADSYLAEMNSKDQKKLERELLSYVKDEKSAKELAKYITSQPKVGLVKVGFREGDNAQLSKVTLDGYSVTRSKKQSSKKKTKKKETKKTEKKTEDLNEIKDEKPSDEAKQTKKMKSKDEGLSKSLRDRIVGKERARTRSGI